MVLKLSLEEKIERRKQKVKEYYDKYCQKNKEKVKEYQRAYLKERYRQEVDYYANAECKVLCEMIYNLQPKAPHKKTGPKPKTKN